MDSFSLDATTRVAVIGAGSMGAGIAQLAAQAGHTVRLFDVHPGAAARALERIARDLDGAVQRGRMAAGERDAVRARLVAVERLEALEGCGLAVEAIVEKLEPKQALFRQLEEVLGEHAVLATNTSSISVTAVAQGLKRPQRLIGWHFFNPATRMKLVEIIRGVETDPALVPALHALSKAWGKTAVDAPNAPGFIVNRVARPYYAEGLRLLAERIAPVAAIDRLLREAGGFAMGPFELMDLIGVEVNLSVTESVFQATAFDARFAPSLIQQELARSGRFGRKSGQGFYRYGADVPAPRVELVEPAAVAPSVACAGRLGLLAPLVERLRAAGVAVAYEASLPDETLLLDGVRVALTDGRTATERAATEVDGPLLLLDLARDFAATPLLGAAAGAGAEAHLSTLAAVLQAAGIGLQALDDVAGLVLMRTVCCLANEAADVITWSGATARDIDTAMRLGTAYPLGPLAWADALGAARVATVLRHLQAHYGEVRYRRSPLLTRLQHARGTFHS
ncbi:3-hydroxyacyl-CoA dehydrogenase [Azohydromonas caseinilytica]|uniref:3-hydroxyacyl-CoA dehydrogenase n=1 Tax=Azohydromonas caseinilytica TaxID=2728836 RepID=A0A848FGQ5_9BURK|nr:3-hydroxyacyl-CoA dehydrogenase [Azohydromonas caseinilytica]NML18524.1 3-hydroxyacyl-CoA dehydrogenase [Azohydromonas caseinilytica]